MSRYVGLGQTIRLYALGLGTTLGLCGDLGFTPPLPSPAGRAVHAHPGIKSLPAPVHRSIARSSSGTALLNALQYAGRFSFHTEEEGPHEVGLFGNVMDGACEAPPRDVISLCDSSMVKLVT